MHIRVRALSVVCALFVVLFACVIAVSAQDKKPAAKPDKAQQAETAAAVKIVDEAMGGKAAPSDYKFTWTNHSMKSRDGKAFVPFTLTFEKGQTLPANPTFYVRVVNKASVADMQKAMAAHNAAVEKAATAARLDPENADLADAETKLRAQAPKPEYTFEDLKFVSFSAAQPNAPFRFQSALMASGGDYDVYVLIKEAAASVKEKKAQPKAGLLKVALTVPNYWTEELDTSSVIVTNTVEQLTTPPTAADLVRNPYIFGLTKVTPSMDFKFAKKDDLSILFYIYNTGFDKAGKPDLTVDYNFYHKVDGAEKFFNKTAPQILNASTLGQFDAKAGHQLLGGQALPLGSFPEGEYRLEIKILDKVTGKTKVENSAFTVIPG